jgi:hypothetical protein
LRPAEIFSPLELRPPFLVVGKNKKRQKDVGQKIVADEATLHFFALDFLALSLGMEPRKTRKTRKGQHEIICVYLCPSVAHSFFVSIVPFVVPIFGCGCGRSKFSALSAFQLFR